MDSFSFTYRQYCKDNSLMIIVPHEDDEINLAGSSIITACQENLRVICVFLTNGDWEYPAFVRINEAVKSLKIMGVSEENIIFLGYPDGGAAAEKSIFRISAPRENQEHKETYGTETHPDFAYSNHGRHSSYTWKNLLCDLENVILKFKPGIILATDFDRHPDHRMASIAFDTVMGNILNDYYANGKYLPVVLKGFCYCTGFESVADFYGRHLLSSVVNKEKIQSSKFDTDNPVYEWDKRVRIPVPIETRLDLRHNLIFKALYAHVSQKAIWKHKPEKIINGDQVFWYRRTENLIYKGKVSASSGNTEYLHDFQMMNTLDIRREKTIYQEYLWVPDKDDTEKWCRCDFSRPQHIEAIAFYGNLDSENRILKGRLVFSTGYSCEVGKFNKIGRETLVKVNPQENVKWVKFEIIESEGNQAGISEWEILENMNARIQVIQICVDGNFAYDWYVYPDESPVISAYTYGIYSEVNWFIDGQCTTLNEINKYVKQTKRKLRIRAEVKDNPNLWSEAEIIPASSSYQIRKKIGKSLDKTYVYLEKQFQKVPHHKLRSLKNKKR
ncbi:PIG-L family deacetylase [Dialister sp.]|uniref:PIG-L family deacetylase n=1 Tax=Dialister sp. TaxID=1955814 RepID=UPI003F0359F2